MPTAIASTARRVSSKTRHRGEAGGELGVGRIQRQRCRIEHELRRDQRNERTGGGIAQRVLHPLRQRHAVTEQQKHVARDDRDRRQSRDRQPDVARRHHDSAPGRPRSASLSAPIATATPAMTASTRPSFSGNAGRKHGDDARGDTAGHCRPALEHRCRHHDQRQDRGELEPPARRNQACEQDAEHRRGLPRDPCRDGNAEIEPALRGAAAFATSALRPGARRRSPPSCRPRGSREPAVVRAAGDRSRATSVAEKMTKRRLTMVAVSSAIPTGAPTAISGSTAICALPA